MSDGRRGFMRWLDRYIYVDRLHWSWPRILPRMRPWEWVRYVAVATASGPLLMGSLDAVQAWVRPLWAGWLLALLAYPLVLLVAGLVWLFALPARAAREATPGESWLFGGLCALGGAAWPLIRPAAMALWSKLF